METLIQIIVGVMVFLAGVIVGISGNKSMSIRVIEDGVLKHIKSDEFIAFERLYFLLELGPKDIPNLVMVLGKLVEKETIERRSQKGFHSLYRRRLDVSA